MIGAIFNCFCIPVQLAFNPEVMEGSVFNFINLCIDFVFVLDIVVSFRTSYIDNKGNEVFNPYRIARKYLKSTFMIDLAAVIPFDMFTDDPES